MGIRVKRKYWILLIFCLGILLLDQWTKTMVVQKLHLYQRVEVIEGFFNIVHVRNTGGAFGIFGGEKGGLGSILFVVVSLIAVCWPCELQPMIKAKAANKFFISYNFKIVFDKSISI